MSSLSTSVAVIQDPIRDVTFAIDTHTPAPQGDGRTWAGVGQSRFAVRGLPAFLPNWLPRGGALLQDRPGALEFSGDSLFIREHRAVLRREDLVWESLDGVVGNGLPRLGAEDEADGWVLPGARPVLARVVQVQVHLAGIGVRELPELEVDDDKATQQAMKEDEIDPVLLVIEPQAPLAPHEREIISQLEEKCLQSRDECSFQIALRILVLEIT